MKKATGTIICLMFVLHGALSCAGTVSGRLSEKITTTPAGTMIPVIVRMSHQALSDRAQCGDGWGSRAVRARRVMRSLKTTASEGQAALVARIEQERKRGRVSGYTPYWIFNGLALRGTRDLIEELALREDVDSITEDIPIPLPAFSSSTPLQTTVCDRWNLERIRVPEVWDRGYDGTGVVVGIFDTGVDVTHPDLASSFRGGSNSWFDPHGEHTFPVDAAGPATGHGTHVAGIMVGGDSSGFPIGVAPGARWIAARIWNDAGDEALSSDLHTIFQWFMDPDGDPETDDFPHVINNSWGFTLLDAFPWCLPELQDDIRAWREAGILPVFSAGNAGPWFFSGESPGNYTETIAVGASNPFDRVALFSSRGPGNCDRKLFPDMVAPGVAVCSTAPGGRYQYISGTSQAAPHVTGTIALMLCADPDLSMEEIELLLKVTSHPVGLLRPNFSSGWGRIDALKAVRAVIP